MEGSKFETNNVDLGAFLMLEGLRYTGCRVEVDRRGEPQAVMIFDDPKEVCRDLERVFINSREKRYRELNKSLLRDVHREVRIFNTKLKEKLEGA